MLPIEALKISSELIRPLARRFMPQAVVRFFHGLGVSLNRWSTAIQARLPEPLALCIKLLLAWVLLLLIALSFVFVPGIAKIIIGMIFAGIAARRIQHQKP